MAAAGSKASTCRPAGETSAPPRFVVTNGEINAITTAAHCPDELTYVDGTAASVTLPMIGSWGAAYRDVQINGSADSPDPYFYSNRGAGTLRQLADLAQRREHARGRLRLPLWRKLGLQLRDGRADRLCAAGRPVRRPLLADLGDGQRAGCVPGDSGGPVFSGDVAFGIAKGVNRDDLGPLPILLLYVDRLSAAAVAAADRRATSVRGDQVAPDLVGAGHRLGGIVADLHDRGSARRHGRRAA